jgi:hypothetical protein
MGGGSRWLAEEEAVGDGAPSGDVGGDSSCNQVLEEEESTAVLRVSSEGDGMGWRWPAMADTVAAGMSRGGGESEVRGQKWNGGGSPPSSRHEGISASPPGATMTGASALSTMSVVTAW